MDKPQLSDDDAEASRKLVDGDKIEIRPQMAATPQNGDTRIDMVEVRQAFVGMGKEELMKFANDPFWVKLRWFLFALFWILWFGMLFGAVAIIAYAPKCSAPAERGWYEKSPLYLINADQLRGNDDKEITLSEGLLLMKDHLQDLDIKSVLLDLNSENDDDFKTLPKKYGSEDSLKKALSTLRDAGIHTFLKIVPNHVSIKHPWFTKSAMNEEEYASYIVWSPAKNDGPPTNWISFDGQSAWTFDDKRGQYYLHQDNSSYADINFRNPNMTAYFSDVFKYWLSFGFCGIHLEKVAYLVEDQSLGDELPSSVNDGNLGEYNFLTHSKTANLDETYKIIEEWAAVISNSSGVLSVDRVSDLVDVPAKLIQRPFVVVPNSNPIQTQLKLYIQSVEQKPHQLWMISPASVKNLSSENIENINLLFMLLNGSSMISSGVEVGRVKPQIQQVSHWKSSSTDGEIQSQKLFSTFHQVIKLRESPSIIYGDTKILTNSSVLLISRIKQGNPGYLISLNLDNNPHDVDLEESQNQGVGEKLTLLVSSKNITDVNTGTLLPVNEAVKAKLITIPPSSFAVFEYIEDSS